ncbi:anhydro-N-acetylmuramic acid kinase [Arenimonas sp.]|jgi:anhydro-N-acetylmuramic acid kinase|uniref:anhydro-N-acetylmuramic acid kinase n=1 Tax=Arenimonas sp. TaxID=1872635 RepID=UPI0037BFFFAE
MSSSLYIGLMSGTSLDGIDVALVDFNNGAELLAHGHCRLPAELTDRLLALSQSNAPVSLEQVGQLETLLGEAFAEAVMAFCAEHRLSPESIRAIGSHGQTLRHDPKGDIPYTLQLGDANILAERTGITTVADFRRRDVAAGGQGAPLVPAFHAALFSEAGQNRAVVNIGGIANVTLLSGDGRLSGFDCGPGNGLMDAWCRKHWGIAFDAEGRKAALGAADAELLERLLSDPWLQLAPPKSTGRDYFQLDWLDYHLRGLQLSPESVLCTLNVFTARAIAEAIQLYDRTPELVFVCGGGVHNTLLMQHLQALLTCPVQSTAALGVNPDYVEAMAFAWLAKQCLESLSGNVVEVTGAAGPRILGAIYQA